MRTWSIRSLLAVAVAGCALLMLPGLATAAAPDAQAPDSPYDARGATPVTVVVDGGAAGLAYTTQSPPSHGTLGAPSSTAHGATLTYTAADGFAGSDSFTIRVSDGVQHTDVPVYVTVHPATELLAGPGTGSTSPLTTTATPTFTFRAVTGGAAVTPATYRCWIDGSSTYVACNSGSFTIPGSAQLADGEHTLTVRAASGAVVDTDPVTATFVVDTTFPVVDLPDGPESRDALDSATLSFTTDQDPNGSVVTECRLVQPSDVLVDDTTPAWSPCASPVTYTGLETGVNTIWVRAIDPAGNVTPSSRTFLVQSSPSFVAQGDRPLTGTFGAAADADGALSYAVVTSPQHGTLSGLSTAPDFTYTATTGYVGPDVIRVRSTDGNGGDQVRDIAITVTPTSSFTATPPAETNDTTPTWTFASAVHGVTFECRLDSSDDQDWAPCDEGTYTAGELPEGDHTFEVRATAHPGSGDLVEVDPISSTVTVDTTNPDVTIDAAPDALSNERTPAFSFSSTDGTATFECSVDGGAFVACPSGAALTSLADGDHTFAVRAKDPATNLSDPVATYAWEVDATAPSIALGGTPSEAVNGPGEGGITGARKPKWWFTASDVSANPGHADHLVTSSIVCSVDGQAPAVCATPWQIGTSLSEGSHTLRISAADTAGNVAHYTSQFTVDTVPPPVVLVDRPNTLSGTSVSFSFRSDADNPDARFECRVVGVGSGVPSTTWHACTSPEALSGLSGGQRRYEVHAIDPAGNVSTSPATYTWTVKSTVPTTSLTKTPATETADTTASFWFSADDALATFQCKVDDGEFSACSSPLEKTGVAVGVHTITVQGINNVAAREPVGAVYSWTVTTTTTPPTTPTTTATTPTVTVTTPAKTVTTPGSTVTTPGPTVTTVSCDVIPAAKVASSTLAVQKGLSLSLTASRGIARLGKDTFTLGLATSGKGSASARLKALSKAVTSIELQQAGKTVATLKGSKWSGVAVTPSTAGTMKLTAKVNRKKGKALKAALSLSVLPKCA